MPRFRVKMHRLEMRFGVIEVEAKNLTDARREADKVAKDVKYGEPTEVLYGTEPKNPAEEMVRCGQCGGWEVRKDSHYNPDYRKWVGPCCWKGPRPTK